MPTPQIAAAKLAEHRPNRTSARHPVLSSICGVVMVLLLLELAFRPWGDQLSPYDMRPVSEDSLNSPVRTVRFFIEGIATSHFTPSRARLTGNPVLPNAPYAVILGDSFVEALQVNDRDTMGSDLERTARAAGYPLNVRQYGWSGDSPIHYAAVAPQVLQKWSPQMVIVVTNWDDWDKSALDSHYAWATLNDGKLTVHLKNTAPDHSFKARLWRVSRVTALGEQTLHRFARDLAPAFQRKPTSNASVKESSPEQVRAALELLQQAYGDRLFVIYAAEPGLRGTAPEPTESLVLAQCTAVNVRCASTGPAWIHARDSGAYLVSGFSNTDPGKGHYNAAGHRLFSDLIWNELQSRRAGGD